MPKLAIVGCGGMGRHHAQVLTKKLGLHIAAASDEFPEARERFKAEYPDAEVFADHRALLEKARPDAAWICLPTFLHAPVALDCARAKVHMVIEKPMALTGAQCRVMDETARAEGVRLMVAFCRRFDNHWGALRRLLVQDGALGRPVVWRQAFASGGQRTWFLDREKGGGPFLDGCVHNHDFCLWTFGPARSVKASLLRLTANTAYDTGVADVVFERGDRTTLNWSWGLPAGARGQNVQDILGPAGVLFFGLPDGQRPKDFNPETHDGFHIVRGKDQVEVVTFEKNDMYESEDRYFLDCVAAGRDPVPGGAEGIAATDLAERIFRDAERPGS